MVVRGVGGSAGFPECRVVSRGKCRRSRELLLREKKEELVEMSIIGLFGCGMGLRQ